MELSPGWLGLIRGLGFALLFAVLSYLGDAANLHGIVNESVAALISSLALALEHAMENKEKGTALFGSVTVRK